MKATKFTAGYSQRISSNVLPGLSWVNKSWQSSDEPIIEPSFSFMTNSYSACLIVALNELIESLLKSSEDHLDGALIFPLQEKEQSLTITRSFEHAIVRFHVTGLYEGNSHGVVLRAIEGLFDGENGPIIDSLGHYEFIDQTVEFELFYGSVEEAKRQWKHDSAEVVEKLEYYFEHIR